MAADGRPSLGGAPGALAAGAAAPRAPLAPPADAVVAFLQSLGTGDVVHTGGEAFSDHLVGVYDVTCWWDAPLPARLAGLIHSVYGTEGFTGFSLDATPENRARIADLAGAEAERMAFIFCGLDRASQDAGLAAGDQTTACWKPRAGAPGGAAAWQEALDSAPPSFFRDFTLLTLGDWMQQCETAAELASDHFGWGVGQAWDYRRTAYAQMAALLGGPAAAMHAAVMAREPDGQRDYEWVGWPEGRAPAGV